MASSSCPTINPNTAKAKIHELMQKFDKASDKNKGDHIIEFFDSESYSIGGSARTRRRRRRQHKITGGRIFSRRNIRITLYLIVAALVAYSFTGTNVATVKEGISMLLNGECERVNNALWGYINMENPVCRLHNQMFKQILGAIAGEGDAIKMLTAIIVKCVGAPLSIAASIEGLAFTIEGTLKLAHSQLQDHVHRAHEAPLQIEDDTIIHKPSMVRSDLIQIEDAKKIPKSRASRAARSSRKSKSPTPTTTTRRTTPKLFPGQTTY